MEDKIPEQPTFAEIIEELGEGINPNLAGLLLTNPNADTFEFSMIGGFLNKQEGRKKVYEDTFGIIEFISRIATNKHSSGDIVHYFLRPNSERPNRIEVYNNPTSGKKYITAIKSFNTNKEL